MRKRVVGTVCSVLLVSACLFGGGDSNSAVDNNSENETNNNSAQTNNGTVAPNNNSALEPSNSTAGTSNNAASTSPNNGSTGGGSTTDMGQACDDCAAGATRCWDDLHQECVNEADDSNECTTWVTVEQCAGNEICDAGEGCTCEDACEPNGEIDCRPNGAFTCLVIDGCATSVRIDRNERCDPPGTSMLDCSDTPDHPYCAPCADGRTCEQLCEGYDFYGCQ